MKLTVIINKSFKFNKEAFEGELDRFLDIPDNHEELVRKSDSYRHVKYPVTFTPLPDGDWVAEHPDLPGCKAHGRTPEEAAAKLEEIKLSWIYAALAEGYRIPEPGQNMRVAITS